jgi:hypothetical protein
MSARRRSRCLWSRGLGSLGLACALTLASPAFPTADVALAQDSAADAAKAFEEGRKLWDAKEPAKALPLFQRAVTQSQSPNARLYVARCLRETGNLAEAYDEMARTVRDATKLAESDPRYAQTRDTSAAELALLEPKIGKLVVTLDSTLAGATVTLDGAVVDPSLLGKPMTVLPRTMKIVATTSDGVATEQSATVAAGATQSVTVARAPGAATGPDTPPVTSPPATDEGGGFGVVRGVGIGVAALGVGGFVAFAIGTVNADADFAKLEDECGAGPCAGAQYDDVISSGKTNETIAYVGLGVGIAGVVAGTMMMIFGGADEPEKPTAASWEPTSDGVRIRF